MFAKVETATLKIATLLLFAKCNSDAIAPTTGQK